MENNYSNFDMLDKMIANNKKAKSWTAFWMVMLCLMAAAVLWLAYTVSEKTNIINDQVEVIESNEFNLEIKSRIIDSLTENCNDAKTEIIKDYDSVITQTQAALAIVNTQPDANMQFTPLQQEKLKEANTSIEKIRDNIKIVRADIAKNSTRLFVQYNNTENADEIKRLLSVLKAKSEYIIVPPEYIDKVFGTTIKFYNYRNADEEKSLIRLLSRYLRISAKEIEIKYEQNKNIKPTVEVWIGTRTATMIRTLQNQD